MNQFGWLLERGSGGRTNFFNLLQKDEVPRKGGGGSNPGGNYAIIFH